MAIVLPKPREIVAATAVNPEHLFLYGPPKSGKTELCCQFTVENNALLVDIDPRQGSKYQEGTKVWAPTLSSLQEVVKAIKAMGCPYERIILDTVSDLQDLAIIAGTRRYLRSNLRAKEFNEDRDSILDLPWGSGQGWVRGAFADLINAFNEVAHNKLILIGHVRDKEVVDKDGVQKVQSIVSSSAIDLIGKVRAITCSHVDAIGYVYRKMRDDGLGQDMWVNFHHAYSEDIVCGTRPKHLIKMHEKFDWNRIFLRDEKGNIL